MFSKLLKDEHSYNFYLNQETEVYQLPQKLLTGVPHPPTDPILSPICYGLTAFYDNDLPKLPDVPVGSLSNTQYSIYTQNLTEETKKLMKNNLKCRKIWGSINSSSL